MEATPQDKVTAWSRALREAIVAADEPRYRRTLNRFLASREGANWALRHLRQVRGRQAVWKVYRRLGPALGLGEPGELAAWSLRDERQPLAMPAGSRDIVAMVLPYMRFAREWSRAAAVDLNCGIAVAMMFFEPLLPLCEAAAAAHGIARESPPADAPAASAAAVARVRARRDPRKTKGAATQTSAGA
jgi:hypothetical protein